MVEVRRNGIVEARHRVHAVAVRGEAVLSAAGDPQLTCFMRSASKPIQALPLARARDDRDDLDDRDFAIACASHRATDDQIVRSRAHGCGRRHHAPLIVVRCAGGSHAGRNDHEIRLLNRFAHKFNFMRRSYNTIEAGCGSESRKAFDLILSV